MVLPGGTAYISMYSKLEKHRLCSGVPSIYPESQLVIL